MSGLAKGRGKVLGLTTVAAVALTTLSSGAAAQAAHQDPAQVRAAFKAAPLSRAFSPATPATSTIPSVCTVQSHAPNKVVLGGAAVNKTFSVTVTGCTLADWFLATAPFFSDVNGETTGVAGTYAYAKLDADGQPVLDGDGKPVMVQLSPTISLSPQGLSNTDAGKMKDGALVGAWGQEDPADTDEVSVSPAEAALPFTLQRR